MTWRLHYYNDKSGEPLWGEVKGEWSDEILQQAVQKVKECLTPDDENEYDIDIHDLYDVTDTVKEFLPDPIREVL